MFPCRWYFSGPATVSPSYLSPLFVSFSQVLLELENLQHRALAQQPSVSRALKRAYTLVSVNSVGDIFRTHEVGVEFLTRKSLGKVETGHAATPKFGVLPLGVPRDRIRGVGRNWEKRWHCQVCSRSFNACVRTGRSSAVKTISASSRVALHRGVLPGLFLLLSGERSLAHLSECRRLFLAAAV